MKRPGKQNKTTERERERLLAKAEILELNLSHTLTYWYWGHWNGQLLGVFGAALPVRSPTAFISCDKCCSHVSDLDT